MRGQPGKAIGGNNIGLWGVRIMNNLLLVTLMRSFCDPMAAIPAGESAP